MGWWIGWTLFPAGVQQVEAEGAVAMGEGAVQQRDTLILQVAVPGHQAIQHGAEMVHRLRAVAR
ncbi:hypothetical protein A7D27_25405 [Pseudomonas sp. 1D4]|nr:hypothetical protein A7D27_25405 [Pseudomonas sp. 1D4]